MSYFIDCKEGSALATALLMGALAHSPLVSYVFELIHVLYWGVRRIHLSFFVDMDQVDVRDEGDAQIRKQWS